LRGRYRRFADRAVLIDLCDVIAFVFGEINAPSCPDTIDAGPDLFGKVNSVRFRRFAAGRFVRRMLGEINKSVAAGHDAAGTAFGLGSFMYWIFPSVPMRPMRLPFGSVNHNAPSGPK